MEFSMPSCTGCKTCEMACSFKNTGEYSPKLAAIAIVPGEDEIGFWVSLDRDDPERKLDCAGCLECLKYCPESDDLKAIIVGYLKNKRAASK